MLEGETVDGVGEEVGRGQKPGRPASSWWEERGFNGMKGSQTELSPLPPASPRLPRPLSKGLPLILALLTCPATPGAGKLAPSSELGSKMSPIILSSLCLPPTPHPFPSRVGEPGEAQRGCFFVFLL